MLHEQYTQLYTSSQLPNHQLLFCQPRSFPRSCLYKLVPEPSMEGTPRQSFLITQFQNIVTLFWNFNPLTIEPIEYNSLILIKHKLSHVRKSNSLCILHFNCPHIKINLSNCTNCTFHVVTFTQLIGASRHWDLLLCTIFLI